jgi:hypothetical protein
MIPTRPHPITRLAPGDENLKVWESLPRLQGANLFRTRNLKPRAQVLAESPAGDPLLVAGEYGTGRVLAFAGDSTSRWWQFGRQSEFRRFWRQTILWLAQRDESQRNEVWVQLSQRRLPVGATASFKAGARSAAGDVLTGAVFTAELVAPGGSRRPLLVSASGGGEVSGEIGELSAPGDYRVEVRVSDEGQPAGSAQASFQVLDLDVELGNPAADFDLLARLAMQTRDAGGRPVSPEELPQLMRDIQQRQRESEVEVQTRWQLGDAPGHTWLFLLAFVGALTAEWYLRKRWGLV